MRFLTSFFKKFSPLETKSAEAEQIFRQFAVTLFALKNATAKPKVRPKLKKVLSH